MPPIGKLRPAMSSNNAEERGKSPHEGNRSNGSSCGYGRDEAGRAARAAGGDKRRHRSEFMRRIRRELRWGGPGPGPIAWTVAERRRSPATCWPEWSPPRLRHDGTVGRTAGVRPCRLVSRRRPGGVRGRRTRNVARSRATSNSPWARACESGPDGVTGLFRTAAFGRGRASSRTARPAQSGRWSSSSRVSQAPLSSAPDGPPTVRRRWTSARRTHRPRNDAWKRRRRRFGVRSHVGLIGKRSARLI